MKVYTRTGDSGLTSIVGGQRLPKTDARIEAYGTVDELNSWLGMLMADPDCPSAERLLMERTQSLLFNIGGRLAGTPSSGITADHIRALEQSIDSMDSALVPLKRFILPGGTPLAAAANVARTVCRRTERRMLAVATDIALEPEPLAFINRLSDWLFTFVRFCNAKKGVTENFWQKDC